MVWRRRAGSSAAHIAPGRPRNAPSGCEADIRGHHFRHAREERREGSHTTEGGGESKRGEQAREQHKEPAREGEREEEHEAPAAGQAQLEAELAGQETAGGRRVEGPRDGGEAAIVL